MKPFLYLLLLFVFTYPVCYAQLPDVPDIHEELTKAERANQSNIPVENKLSYFLNASCGYCNRVSETDSIDGAKTGEPDMNGKAAGTKNYSVYSTKATYYDMMGVIKTININKQDRNNPNFYTHRIATDNYLLAKESNFFIIKRKKSAFDSCIAGQKMIQGYGNNLEESYYFGTDSLLYMKESIQNETSGYSMHLPETTWFAYGSCRGVPYLKNWRREEQRFDVKNHKTISKGEYKLLDSSNGLTFRKITVEMNVNLKGVAPAMRYDSAVYDTDTVVEHYVADNGVYTFTAKRDMALNKDDYGGSVYNTKDGSLNYTGYRYRQRTAIRKELSKQDSFKLHFETVGMAAPAAYDYKLYENWQSRIYEMVIPDDVNKLTDGGMPSSGKLTKFRYIKYVEKH